jgi:hypothetical protein
MDETAEEVISNGGVSDDRLHESMFRKFLALALFWWLTPGTVAGIFNEAIRKAAIVDAQENHGRLNPWFVYQRILTSIDGRADGLLGQITQSWCPATNPANGFGDSRDDSRGQRFNDNGQICGFGRNK